MTTGIGGSPGGSLAINRSETRTSQHLKVNSGAFAEGDTIPPEYSDYDHGKSFPLAWSEGPVGTRSYVVLVEDPDVKKARTPFVHWVVWNIPARRTNPRGRADAPAARRSGGRAARRDHGGRPRLLRAEATHGRPGAPLSRAGLRHRSAPRAAGRRGARRAGLGDRRPRARERRGSLRTFERASPAPLR